MTKFKTVWFWDSGIPLGDTHTHVMAFYDDSRPKPSVVRNEKSPHHSFCHSFNTSDSDGNQVIHLVDSTFANTPNAWYGYAQLDEMMCTLLSFSNDMYPNGTVVPFREFADKTKPEDSSGFLRWFIKDSRIQQIFVSPDFRRNRLSVKLVAVADILIVADKQWNGIFLNGGDITTADGETLRQAWSESTRVTPRIGSVTI